MTIDFRSIMLLSRAPVQLRHMAIVNVAEASFRADSNKSVNRLKKGESNRVFGIGQLEMPSLSVTHTQTL